MKQYLFFVGLLLGLNVLMSRLAQAQAGYSVFVIGGTGRGTAPQLAQTLRAVQVQAAPLGQHSTLVVLDDRLGRTLLPADGALPTPTQTALLAQLHDFPGRL